jgi:hypothetical protein
VIPRDGDLGDVTEAGHDDQSRPGDLSVTELTVVVVAPHGQGAVGQHCGTGVIAFRRAVTAGGYLHRAGRPGEGRGRGEGRTAWPAGRVGSNLAQDLAVPVRAPGEHARRSQRRPGGGRDCSAAISMPASPATAVMVRMRPLIPRPMGISWLRWLSAGRAMLAGMTAQRMSLR